MISVLTVLYHLVPKSEEYISSNYLVMPYHVNNTENVASSNRIVEMYLIVKVDYIRLNIFDYLSRQVIYHKFRNRHTFCNLRVAAIVLNC